MFDTTPTPTSLSMPPCDLLSSVWSVRSLREWRTLDAHISGVELLEGIRAFALTQFGLMTCTVFRRWGIRSTDDFGNIVFELIERGEMSKTDRDQLSDFFEVYDFADVFDRDYQVEVQRAFTK